MFTYDGSFELELLEDDETVCAAGDGSGACLVESPDGMTRIDVGDIVHRKDGRLTTVPSPLRR